MGRTFSIKEGFLWSAVGRKLVPANMQLNRYRAPLSGVYDLVEIDGFSGKFQGAANVACALQWAIC